ncbi:MAG: molybdopterin-synthase adenylyltransferase MoeB [Chitinophagaceae bacterium]
MSYEDISFSSDELARYNRHIVIPGFGLQAQQKLKNSRVLVVGSGGLGSPALLYLAAAGVGTLGIVDFDVVESSNLQRQVLFGADDVGALKVDAAKSRLETLNPHIAIKTYPAKLDSGNALDILQDYDVVTDGTDNFPSRYLINDACVLLGKPNVYGSVFRFEGQLSVFNYRDKHGEPGPNYRDLYPDPPAAGLIPDCAEGGVLGVLPGIIGSLQALEAIKIITGAGQVTSGRLLLFDALTLESSVVQIKRRPDNPLNGTNPTLTGLIDYEAFCGVIAEKPVREISPMELLNWQQNGELFQLIDVREPDEYLLVNIGAELMPLSTITHYAGRIARDKKVVLHCQMGTRSARAIRELEKKFGLENLYSLQGGMVAYLELM